MKAFTQNLAFSVLLVLAALPVSVNAVADQASLALDILQNLEVNTFHNSLRPKHYPEGTTVSQTPYHHFTKNAGVKDSYYATDDEKNWHYSLSVLHQSD